MYQLTDNEAMAIELLTPSTASDIRTAVTKGDTAAYNQAAFVGLNAIKKRTGVDYLTLRGSHATKAEQLAGAVVAAEHQRRLLKKQEDRARRAEALKDFTTANALVAALASGCRKAIVKSNREDLRTWVSQHDGRVRAAEEQLEVVAELIETASTLEAQARQARREALDAAMTYQSALNRILARVTDGGTPASQALDPLALNRAKVAKWIEEGTNAEIMWAKLTNLKDRYLAKFERAAG